MTLEDTLQSCFAIAAPGLEPLVARELTGLGLTTTAEDGGVGFAGRIEDVARANLWLRTASRVVVRVASFEVRSFAELERKARRIEWERHTPKGTPVRFRVTCKKSKLYHSDAVAQRLMDAAMRAGARASDAPATSDDDEAGDDTQLYIVRMFHDICTVSADSSGALLHRRGYRQETGKAPMRETLAAAMLVASDYDGSLPLLDPLCGSGTIAIEGAMIARRLAPGRLRTFRFTRWPRFNDTMWRDLLAAAERQSLPAAPAAIVATDRDAGAVQITKANAERAGVAADVRAEQRALSAMEPDAAPHGLLATNPPYGIRVGETDALRDLYARFGDVIRERRQGWRVTILGADPKLEAQTRLGLKPVLKTTNGGIPVRILSGEP